jgi:DNA-binding response OmpR family regulator
MLSSNADNKPAILIVDDNPRNLQVLGGFLKKEGHLVEFAVDGYSALTFLNNKKFDLILLDIMMPGMNGYELCMKIKEIPALSDIPVIFITAVSDSESIVKGFNLGAVDYITKPFIQSELLVRVRTQLSAVKSKQQILHYLKDIESHNKDINNSITYARNIQNAVLNTTNVGGDNIPDHFILNMPKDILSGDFYWVDKIDDQVIFSVMDSTGHGVPGALMSILGVTLLNDTVIRERILQPDKILESLRKKLVKALGQNTDIVSIKDGIEGSVLNFNRTTSSIKLSGTQNPVLHFHDGVMTEIKADKIPIGFYEKEVRFSMRCLDIKSGDMIYLYSDGYIDQFGGPEMKKIMSKRFKELLLSYHNLPLETQKTKLEEYILNWMKDSVQTDDILVMGIRF